MRHLWATLCCVQLTAGCFAANSFCAKRKHWQSVFVLFFNFALWSLISCYRQNEDPRRTRVVSITGQKIAAYKIPRLEDHYGQILSSNEGVYFETWKHWPPGNTILVWWSWASKELSAPISLAVKSSPTVVFKLATEQLSTEHWLKQNWSQAIQVLEWPSSVFIFSGHHSETTTFTCGNKHTTIIPGNASLFFISILHLVTHISLVVERYLCAHHRGDLLLLSSRRTLCPLVSNFGRDGLLQVWQKWAPSKAMSWFLVCLFSKSPLEL